MLLIIFQETLSPQDRLIVKHGAITCSTFPPTTACKPPTAWSALTSSIKMTMLLSLRRVSTHLMCQRIRLLVLRLGVYERMTLTLGRMARWRTVWWLGGGTTRSSWTRSRARSNCCASSISKRYLFVLFYWSISYFCGKKFSKLHNLHNSFIYYMYTQCAWWLGYDYVW